MYGIVTGNDQREKLAGSLRTTRVTFDPDAFLKEALGKDEAGRYFGGGKALAGGFEIPIGFLFGSPSDQYRDLKWQVYQD
ncbi:MAG: hypothetical protein U0401_35255 [Anaerolineae bacterium]